MAPMAFKNLLVKLSNGISSLELEAMKFMCSDEIPRGRLEEIESPLHLWIALEERDLIGQDNVAFLRDMIVNCSQGRTDLLKLVEEYDRTRASTGSESRGENLQFEFGLVADNAGHQWRFLIRRLGVTDGEISNIEADHAKNTREQIYHSLVKWQSKKKDAATKAELIRALRDCRLSIVADMIQD
nr:FAS-associated death domain protein-like protein [Arenicola marina]